MLASPAERAMEFHSPPYPSSPFMDNKLWRPGSTGCTLSPSTDHCKVDLLGHGFPPSPKREPFDPVYLDRMRCRQELQKLYEDTAESSYDLSFKDIVDPCYSISGKLKTMATETEAEDAMRSRSSKGSSIPKLTFSFSFPGLRSRSKRARSNLSADQASLPFDGKDGEAPQLSLCKKPSPSRCARSNSESRAPSMSRIHPSNQCSTCSTYTIFFKCRCLICGKLYCSICAREHMDVRADGFKCKESCKTRLLSRRLSQKIGGGCWPFGNGF